MYVQVSIVLVAGRLIRLIQNNYEYAVHYKLSNMKNIGILYYKKTTEKRVLEGTEQKKWSICQID